MLLDRDSIMKADDRPVEEVECPEWGGTVLVRAMTGEERDAWETAVMQASRDPSGKATANATSKVIVKCMVDEDGNRLFKDSDAGALGKKNAAAINRVWGVAARLSGLRNEDVEALGKTSEHDDPGGDSSSPSPATSDGPARNS